MVEEEGPLGSVPQTTFPAHIIERAIIGHHQVKSTPKVGKRSSWFDHVIDHRDAQPLMYLRPQAETGTINADNAMCEPLAHI
jgi:hypothetical protein